TVVATPPSTWSAAVGQPSAAPAVSDESSAPVPGRARDQGDRAGPDGDTPAAAVADGVVDAADGFIPDGMAVSAFDEAVPAVSELDPDLLDALRRTATDADAAGVGLRVNSGW